MDGYVVHGGLAMARGAFVRVEDGRGMRLYVWQGELWVTQEGDRRDYLVGPGQSFRVDRGGATLACATRPSRITLTAPARGWLEALGVRLARAWANAFVPGSRPTTAAL